MTILLLTRCLSWTEGISFLLLLGVAMPLKYLYGEPMAVRIVGMAHGILFIAMLVAITAVIKRFELPVRMWGWGFIAALLPCGPFIYDRHLTRMIARPK